MLFVIILSFLMAEEDPRLSSKNVSIAQREVRHQDSLLISFIYLFVLLFYQILGCFCEYGPD